MKKKNIENQKTEKDRFIEIEKDDGGFDENVPKVDILNMSANDSLESGIDLLQNILPKDISDDALIVIDTFLSIVSKNDYIFYNDTGVSACCFLKKIIHEILRKNNNVPKEKCESKKCDDCPVYIKFKVVNESLAKLLMAVHSGPIDYKKMSEVLSSILTKISKNKDISTPKE